MYLMLSWNRFDSKCLKKLKYCSSSNLVHDVNVFWFVKSVAIIIVHLLESDLPQNMGGYRRLLALQIFLSFVTATNPPQIRMIGGCWLLHSLKFLQRCPNMWQLSSLAPSIAFIAHLFRHKSQSADDRNHKPQNKNDPP